MLKLGALLEHYTARGRFKILDFFSAPNGLTAYDVQQSLLPSFGSAVVDDPRDRDSYYRLQVGLMGTMGMGGVNSIDSVNERYCMMSNEITRMQETSQYFQRFTTKLGRMKKKESALHIASDIEEDERFNELLCSIQDGKITMRYDGHDNGRVRYLCIDRLRGSWHESRWVEFIIITNKVKLL